MQWEPWAIERGRRHDWRTVLEAGRAIGSFSSREWLGDIDVPDVGDDHDARPRRAGAPPGAPVRGDPRRRGVPGRRRPRRRRRQRRPVRADAARGAIASVVERSDAPT